MTLPRPESGWPIGAVPLSPAERAKARARLARRWAGQISTTEYVPLEPEEFQRSLDAMLDALVTAARADPFQPQQAAAHGAGLVEAGCTGPAALQHTMDVLGKGLLELPELAGSPHNPARVVQLLGALAAGYSEAVRLRTLSQQDTMLKALRVTLQDRSRELTLANARFEHLLAGTSSGVAVTDADGRILVVNDALAKILGLANEELPPGSLFELSHPEDVAALRNAYRSLLEGRSTRTRNEHRLVRADGERIWAVLCLAAVRPGEPGSQVVAVLEDSSELKLLQGQMNRQALHDRLTQLPNRQYFGSNLERVLRHADPAAGITLYHLDLDGFSLITHGLGRQIGDLVLDTVARRLKAVVAQEQAMVARFGADEFAVLVQNGPGTPDVVRMIERITAALAEPLYVGESGLATTACLGVVDRPSRDLSAEQLLEAAELALARAKRNGCAQWALFDPFQDARDRERAGLAAALPGAWETGQLSVAYQPLSTMDGSRVLGVDALLHWDHPRRGPVRHEVCADLAEQTGLIMTLGVAVLRRACAQVQQWRELGHEVPLHVALTANQSADPDLVRHVRSIVDRTGLPPDRLWLGMPAPALLNPATEAAENLRLLAAAGVRTELLEFSATAADLTCLEDLPVRAVRVARALVDRQAHRTGQDSLVARALRELLRLVRETGVTVFVTGVEHEAQADWWQSVGVDAARGGHFGPAGPPERILDLLDPRG
ncbi:MULTISPECIES: EAL domain-containing protein [unclassified Crossiella]|uniref:putative bifunctional diguanylate cyclase/phosphodiesterase n=1 Tax=unclassified Crossiella TaxID=2620835 RepID=UPI001FFF6997|nr:MULTISPECIES: EAL domain-containing protein [unclassified Crossiella]MCK2237470.1 EAL domain-containing protein [Crossiella sp. S99.2]MCK2251125.1 EAL domain-containing protein [Crossiella sp. S99.1]